MIVEYLRILKLLPQKNSGATNPSDPSGPGVRVTAAVLLIFSFTFAALEIGSYRQKSATWDEPIHLTAGYAAVASGDYRVDPTHPPFSRMWAALPLLALGIHIDTTKIDQTPVADRLVIGYVFAREFLYRDNDADRLLYAARFMVVFWAIGLGILVFFWAREWLGFTPAVLALAFYTIEPNIAANGRLVTTDLASALFIFGAVYWLWRMCRRPSVFNAAGLAVCFALAFVSKFSGVLLIPIVIVLLGISVARQSRIRIGTSVALLLLLAVTTYVTVWATYGFRYAPSESGTWQLQARDFPELRERMPLLASITTWVDDHRLLPNAFTEGFFLSQSTARLSAYLGGEISSEGWWYYFPMAFVVKTPTVLILLFLAGLVLFFVRRRGKGLFDCAFVLAPVIIYLGFAMVSRINIGVRHILPIYPFVLLIAAYSAKQLVAWRRPLGAYALGGLMALWVGMFVLVYPNMLTFFNVVAGGPDNGLDYLSDSNLDWGQDLKQLKSWMNSRNVSRVNLAYFGTADPGYYGISYSSLPGTSMAAAGEITRPLLPGYVAISATVLSGVYLTPQWRLFYSGFLNEQPVADIGNSIRVYWVEHWPEANSGAGTLAEAELQRWLGDALLYDLKWSDHALIHYRASLVKLPEDRASLRNVVMALMQSGQTSEAIGTLQRAAELEPEDGELQNLLSYVFLQNRQLAESRTHAETAIRLVPNDPVAHNLLGVALTGLGRLDAAAESFERALEIAPDYEDARRHLSMLKNHNQSAGRK